MRQNEMLGKRGKGQSDVDTARTKPDMSDGRGAIRIPHDNSSLRMLNLPINVSYRLLASQAGSFS